MNVAKHMEAIVITAAVLLGASCYAPAPALQVASSSYQGVAIASTPATHIVQVKAMRLTPAQKSLLV